MIGRLYGSVRQSVKIEGYAQDFDFPITAVQFSGDEGQTWTEFTIEQADPLCNVNWSFEFTPKEVGIHRILIRAIRADGKASPEAACVEVCAQEELALP